MIMMGGSNKQIPSPASLPLRYVALTTILKSFAVILFLVMVLLEFDVTIAHEVKKRLP